MSSVPMVIVREPDAIIHPYDQQGVSATYSNAEDIVNDYLYVLNEFMQQSRLQYKPAPPPPELDFWEDMTMTMLQNMRSMMKICFYLNIFHTFFPN